MSAYATDADLILLVPSTSGVAANVRSMVLDAAAHLIDLERWGDRAQYGHVMLTAHMLAMLQPAAVGGVGGQVTGRSARDISVTFAATPKEPSDDDLDETRWGRQYKLFRNTVMHGAGVAWGVVVT